MECNRKAQTYIAAIGPFLPKFGQLVFAVLVD